MPQEPADIPRSPRHATRWWGALHGLGPVIGLVLLCIAGTLLNGNFATYDNLMNVLTRTAFIGILAVGMCFVIISGGIDLSVGSMAALIAGSVILFMNAMAPVFGSPFMAVAAGMVLSVVLGAAFGLAHGLLITKGRIEPFIVTLGTLGIFRAYLTYFSNGGAITLDNELSDIYSPVYYANLLGVPFPVWIFLLVALMGGVILNRTAFGRYVQAIGSNEQVAHYAAVDVHGTVLKGGAGSITGTVVGAILLSVISNILNLTSIISVYLNAAVQGFVIIAVAFMQRGKR